MAVGDGANDVNMIKEADIGIGNIVYNIQKIINYLKYIYRNLW